MSRSDRAPRNSWRVPVGLAVVLVLLLIVAALADAAPDDPAPVTTAPVAQAEPCKVVTWKRYGRAVKRTWRYSHRNGDFRAGAKPKARGQRRLGRMRRHCDPRAEREAKMLRHVQRRRAEWRFHARIDRLTPYGPWAIPVPIVRCEGGVNGWNVRNREDGIANGPYQLRLHGQPFPVTTYRHMARHHEIAYNLSRGGTYFGPWTASGRGGSRCHNYS